MQEFGLWISWNLFGPHSGLYLKAGTEIADGEFLPLPIVAIHSGHPSERQRFSVAHELGHHLFAQKGKIGSPTTPSTDSDEKVANLFAANLLMERSRVIKVLKAAAASFLNRPVSNKQDVAFEIVRRHKELLRPRRYDQKMPDLLPG